MKPSSEGKQENDSQTVRSWLEDILRGQSRPDEPDSKGRLPLEALAQTIEFQPFPWRHNIVYKLIALPDTPVTEETFETFINLNNTAMSDRSILDLIGGLIEGRKRKSHKPHDVYNPMHLLCKKAPNVVSDYQRQKEKGLLGQVQEEHLADWLNQKDSLGNLPSHYLWLENTHVVAINQRTTKSSALWSAQDFIDSISHNIYTPNDQGISTLEACVKCLIKGDIAPPQKNSAIHIYDIVMAEKERYILDGNTNSVDTKTKKIKARL